MKQRILGFFLKRSKRTRIRREQYIVLAFASVILLGSVLLSLPAASRSGESSGFLTALFTATSATCVTGLSLADTYVQWSGFGQAVILVMIQIGGLGFMSIVSVFFFLLHRKIGLQQRLMMAQGFGLNDVDGVVHLVRDVLRRTIIFEAAGALILTVRFLGEFGLWQSVKWGVFHAVSAFCNAGFDIFGKLDPGSSLAVFADDWVVNAVIMALIVIGGLGFYVWADIAKKWSWKKLEVHTKLVLCISAALLLGGTLLFALLEWNNPETIGSFSTGDKLLASLFQSVTCRTAGFASISQGGLSEPSKAISIVLMLIGGSAGSTAGGIKTVSVGILFLSVLAAARGKTRVTVFGRTIAGQQIRQAMTVFLLLVSLAFGGAILLSACNMFPFLDCLFETASALGTVGLTTGITPLLGIGSQLLLIIFMFFGRVGILTVSIGFLLGNQAEERFHYAEAKILIG